MESLNFELEGSAGKAVAVAPSCKYLDLDYLMQIAGGDTEFFTELLMTFKNESYIFLKRMNKEFLMNDLIGLSRTAHSMKPSGSYIGVKNLSSLTGHLQDVAAAGNAEQSELLIRQIEKIVLKVIAEIDEYFRVH